MFQSGGGDGGVSFLPADYIARKAERRTTIISLALFSIVMFGVVGAFFVTNRQWNTVKAQQEEINRLYAIEAQKIEQLKVLEKQKQEMLQKAEITTALIERVPRSILLAELVNRLPDDVALDDLELTSERVKVAKPKPEPASKTRTLSGRRALPPQIEEPEARPTVDVPQMRFSLKIEGLAFGDQQVADYHAALKQCELLEDVELISTVGVVLDDRQMRRFNMTAVLRQDADARAIEPLRIPRGGFNPDRDTAAVPEE